MERRELEYFLAIAEHGSYTAAAQALHVAQPSLSHAMSALEHRLGGKLFHRLPNGIALTPAGRALVDPARQVMRDLATATDSVREVLGLTGGQLDIVAQTTLAVDPLAALLGEYLASYPNVAVHVLDPELGREVSASVRSGECELGMVDSATELPEMRSTLLPGREIRVVLPPAFAERAGTRIGLAELATMDFIATPVGTATREIIEDVLGGCADPPRVAIETAHQAMIVPLVVAGAGVSLLPRSMADDATRGGAVVLPLRPRVVRRGRLFWRSGPLSPAAEQFVRLVDRTGNGRKQGR
ncbi:LysR family transcriptional regulator [Sciscionella marina]|uniref:LysR family transcriptional regulator n=1 Tax=Sciscionella marina TaxID=508770 RepID=UPI000371C47E|nr:LysR family transcriptional regulator [Sciscionella marina]